MHVIVDMFSECSRVLRVMNVHRPRENEVGSSLLGPVLNEFQSRPQFEKGTRPHRRSREDEEDHIRILKMMGMRSKEG